MTPHRYTDYTDTTELAYHMHYEHDVSWAEAIHADESDLIVAHRMAHS